MSIWSCLQCTDKTSGVVGDFLHSGDFKAISPVFSHYAALLVWMTDNGYVTDEYVDGKFCPFHVRRVGVNP